jgi:hypothetical protein
MASQGATAKYRPWFERWPELKDWEKGRFDAHGLPWKEVPASETVKGYLVVDSEVEFEGKPLPIRVAYPSEYPELPPFVYSEKPVLDRHQQPFKGNFCLLERPIDSWQSRGWGAADLIVEQLKPLLRDSEAGPDAVRAAEAPMPEPASAHFNYLIPGVVLVPGNLTPPAGDKGRFELRPFDGVRFVLTKADDEKGDSKLLDLLPLGSPLRGRWKRLPTRPPVGPRGKDVLPWIRKEHPELLRTGAPPPPPRKKGKRVSGSAPPLQVAGLVFPEERDAEGRQEDAWMFLGVKHGREGFLIHSQVVSPTERQRRIPDLVDMRDKCAVVVGLGSLGGDVALQLARAGVGELRLVDYDIFEANNSVRHALGIEFAGLDKPNAVAVACRRANPFCEVEPEPICIGSIDEEPPPLQRLEAVFDGADLVVETTGIHQIELLVGRLAWDKGVPLVSCWVTEGSWAGEVLRMVPGETMCMSCFQAGQRQGELLHGDADPEEAMIAVQGCVHPTVSGAGFDAAETAAMTARLASQTMLRAESYPDPEWDHAVANFRHGPDDKDHPRFDAEALPPNKNCERCGDAAG